MNSPYSLGILLLVILVGARWLLGKLEHIQLPLWGLEFVLAGAMVHLIAGPSPEAVDALGRLALCWLGVHAGLDIHLPTLIRLPKKPQLAALAMALGGALGAGLGASWAGCDSFQTLALACVAMAVSPLQIFILSRRLRLPGGETYFLRLSAGLATGWAIISFVLLEILLLPHPLVWALALVLVLPLGVWIMKLPMEETLWPSVLLGVLALGTAVAAAQGISPLALGLILGLVLGHVPKLPDRWLPRLRPLDQPAFAFLALLAGWLWAPWVAGLKESLLLILLFLGGRFLGRWVIAWSSHFALSNPKRPLAFILAQGSQGFPALALLVALRLDDVISGANFAAGMFAVLLMEVVNPLMLLPWSRKQGVRS